jgi:hypothetical protein
VSASTAPVAGPDLAKWQQGALIAGGVGLAVCLIGAFLDAPHYFRAWLVAFNLVLGIALGGLVIVMLQYVVGGNWGFALRRPMEAATRTLPLLTLLFLPIALGAILGGSAQLFPWADPAKVEADRELQHKAPYLNVPFFLIRAAVYFAIWNLLAFLLNRWSRLQDTTKDRRLYQTCANLSAPGICLYALTVTFASVDWMMSLEPHWFSTIYGAMIGIGQVLAGFVFAVAVFLLLSTRPPLDRVAEQQNMRDMGSLMLAFIMVWAYLSFSQFLLIWSGNLPEEVPWYQSRLEPPWQWVALSLVLLHFAMPFFLLLSVDVKRNRHWLTAVALILLAMRFVDLTWLIVPAFNHGHGGESHGGVSVVGALLYPAALVGVGGVWLGVFLWQLQRWPLLPELTPEEAVNHGAEAHH